MILHMNGFVGNDHTDMEVSAHDGSGTSDLARIANGVLDVIRGQGYEVKTGTLRTLDGWLVKVFATVVVDEEHAMWHVFTEPKSTVWPTAVPSPEGEA